jgi:hypothetical protein
LRNALQKFVSLSNKFIVFNLLHTRSKTKEAGYYYQTPNDVQKLLPPIKNVTFIDDYLDNDFSTILEVV